ncbi:hypothetical protein FB465_0889 [Kitasatospora atroaurantiaca]|uniref:Uncharacterized protein n=1 Tax=Kitasatospora atroaurantiaca TaxID=285545 RepID=A0A561EJZ2_9ACTN|nr:hypothetical protein FB465_0889 [Kitasatospora atroaurantiaca]
MAANHLTSGPRPVGMRAPWSVSVAALLRSGTAAGS